MHQEYQQISRMRVPVQATDGSIVSAYVREAVRRAEEERPGRPLPALMASCGTGSHNYLQKELCDWSNAFATRQQQACYPAFQTPCRELMPPESISAAGERSAAGTDWSNSTYAAAVTDHALLA